MITTQLTVASVTSNSSEIDVRTRNDIDDAKTIVMYVSAIALKARHRALCSVTEIDRSPAYVSGS